MFYLTTQKKIDQKSLVSCESRGFKTKFLLVVLLQEFYLYFETLDKKKKAHTKNYAKKE